MPSVINPRSVQRNLDRAEIDRLWLNHGRLLASQFASIFGVQFDLSNAVSQASSGAVNRLATSTFSGFGSRIGARQNFDAVKFTVYPWDANDLPNQIRVAVRTPDNTGTLLASVLVPMPNTAAGVPYEVYAELGELITNDAAAEIFLSISSNGKIGYTEGPSISSPNVQYSTDQSLTRTQQVSTSVTTYGGIFASTFLTGTRNAYSVGYFDTVTQQLSTFSGWGNLLQTIPDTFNACQIWLNAFDASFLPTKVRVRFRDSSATGTVIATAVANVSFGTTGTQLVTFFFPDDIDLSAYSAVWFEYLSDGKVGFSNSSVTHSTSNERYTSGPSGIDALVNTIVPSPTRRIPWVRTWKRDRTSAITFDSGQLLRAIRTQSQAAAADPFQPTVDILMPQRLYGVQNYEANVYFDGMVDSYIPQEALQIRGGTSSTSSGVIEDDRIRVTPTGTGTSSWTVAVDWEGATLNTKTGTMLTKAESVGSGVSRKCLVIGDSIVEGGAVVSTAVANIAANASSTYACTFIGNHGSGSNKYEAVGGWRYSNVVGSGSNFWDGAAFSLSHYLTNLGESMTAGDSVFLLLGTNDFFQEDDDSAVNTQIATVQAQLDEIIADIHSYNASINIWIGMVAQPAYSRTAWGQTYAGTTYIRERVKRNYAMWRRHLITLYDGLWGSYTHLCPVHCCIDTKNNYKTTSVALNARNATTWNRPYDPVHPDTSGEQQIGDLIYACLMSLES